MMDNKEENLEKIEIVERTESKFDNLTPRTEISEFIAEEKKELQEKVLQENNQELQKEVSESKKKSNKSAIITIIIVVLVILLLWFVWPEIKNVIDDTWCGDITDGSNTVQGRCQ